MAPSGPSCPGAGLVSRCAPVAAFALTLVYGPAGAVVEGWAAPAGGFLPCTLELAAGNRLVAVARANRFSAAAATAGQRFGWCGVRIGAVDAAAAIDDEVRLACGASGCTLLRWNAAEILLGAPRATPAATGFLTIPEMGRGLQRATACEDASTVRPFADHLLHDQGPRALVVASYRWILRRTPVPVEVEAFAGGLSRFDPVHRCFSVMLGSPEYLANPSPLAGPFDTRFPFGLGAFGGAAAWGPFPAPPGP